MTISNRVNRGAAINRSPCFLELGGEIVMKKAKYKAVMDGKGGFFIVKRYGWWNWFLFGSQYLPISNSLKD